MLVVAGRLCAVGERTKDGKAPDLGCGVRACMSSQLKSETASRPTPVTPRVFDGADSRSSASVKDAMLSARSEADGGKLG